MYWLSSNVFSLGQVACLRIPAVRTVLKIPQRVVHDPDKLPPRDGFIKSFKKGTGRTRRWGSKNVNGTHGLTPFYTGWKYAEIAHQLREREQRMQKHLDLAARGKYLFRLNSIFLFHLLLCSLRFLFPPGPLRQTFTHNPLLQHGKCNPSNTSNSSSSSSSNKPKTTPPWRDTLG
jgi:YidC/Oxa1 family membrane protein insertase